MRYQTVTLDREDREKHEGPVSEDGVQAQGAPADEDGKQRTAGRSSDPCTARWPPPATGARRGGAEVAEQQATEAPWAPA